MTDRLDAATLEALIAEATKRRDDSFWDTRLGWESVMEWLQAHLDALPKENIPSIQEGVTTALAEYDRGETVLLDALPKEPRIPAGIADDPADIARTNERVDDYEVYSTALNAASPGKVEPPAPRIPPDLAKALLAWIVGFRTCRTVSDESKALAAAIDAARERGEL